MKFPLPPSPNRRNTLVLRAEDLAPLLHEDRQRGQLHHPWFHEPPSEDWADRHEPSAPRSSVIASVCALAAIEAFGLLMLLA